MATALTVYITRPTAPLCARVCEFLDRRGYAYTTVDVGSEQDREAMRQRTGYSSCPLVVSGDDVIGGLRETIEAERSGRLADLAGQPPRIAHGHEGGNRHA